MEEPSKMLTDKEIEHLEKQLKGVFAGAVTVIVLLLSTFVFFACSSPAPGPSLQTEQQEAFLQACDDATDCPGGMVCSLGSDAMPGRCTRGCELPQDCYPLLPAESLNDVTCDVEELLCVARCSRTVGCPEALPACLLGVCAPSCDGQGEETCWYEAH
jgi:hypothetical protein